MSNLQANVPLINVPFVDKNGNVTEAWFIFLIQLWRRTGGGGSTPTTITISDVLALEESFASVGPHVDNPTSLEMIHVTPSQQQLMEMIFAPLANTDYTQGAQSVTLGASPASYKATQKEGFYISGGTVTALTLQRGSTVLPIGNSASDIVDATPAFTAGTSNSVTLTQAFGAVARLWVYFDGVYQGDDQVLSLVGTTLTFTGVIPLGVQKVYVKGLLQSSVGIGSTLIELSPGDVVNVTYSSAPSVTVLAR
jgi:hypothetical protein